MIYQVAWQRLLTVYYGVGPASTALIVSVFMLGLGAGAIVGGRWAERGVDAARRYAVIEVVIGVLGLASITVIDAVGRSTAGADAMVMLAALFLVLVPPTVLMGATLPLLVKAYGRVNDSFLGSVAMLYGVNTLGAAAGCLVAAYGLISMWGLSGAIYAAAFLNLLVALLVFRLRTPADVAAHRDPVSERLGRELYLIAFGSGFLGIGYEILWFRIVAVLVKDSPYAFSSMLATYLLALALGSLLLTAVIRRWSNLDRAAWLAGIQVTIAIVGVLCFALFPLIDRLPFVVDVLNHGFGQQIHPPMTRPTMPIEWVVALDIFLWPAALVGVGAALFGAGFPLLAALGLRDVNRQGDAVSRVYAATILGNVAGGLVTGFVLLPQLKTEGTWLAFTVIGAVLAVVIANGTRAGRRMLLSFAAVAAVVVAAILVGSGTRIYPWLHRLPPATDRLVYFEEGVEGVVLTTVRGETVNNLINGTSHGSRPGFGFYYETIEALTHARDAKRILTIGIGAGSVLEQALMLKEVESLTLVEVNGTLLDNLRKIPLYHPLLNDPRLRIIVDDGRRHLLQTSERYDAILIDPLRTRSAYSNNLYSAEFYELAKSRLAPGGVMMVWTDEFRVMPQTMASVFPHVRLYSFFMLGSPDPMTANPARRDALVTAHTAATQAQLAEYRDIYVGDESLVRRAERRWPINTDRRPVAEYYLGHVYRSWTAHPWTMASWRDEAAP